MENNIWKRMVVFILMALTLSISYQYFVCGTNGKAAQTDGGNVSALDAPKYIAITFDDGPKQGTTDVLLDGLKERGVHATFFLIGKQIDDHEELVRQMYEDGHQIGNHTYSHVNLAMLSTEAGYEELTECFDEIQSVTGLDHCVVRPPYGEVSTTMKNTIGCPMILWSVDTNDWTGKTTDQIANYIVKTAKEGDIVLLHDIYANSVKGALKAIDAMIEKGYTFVTVSELFERKGITMESGKIYRKAY